ncbi:hypothetical protein [Fischerella thermalis]|uniref:hypothetical protein n=1 Tax=Fischerella thermalis TaxID=372787 RepID=UPI0019FA5A63|nr:hypothetical protein [Fischerella thermalis]MBF2069270.1 hypothetical protein [Fischerella thermalis M48_A2018_028]
MYPRVFLVNRLTAIAAAFLASSQTAAKQHKPNAKKNPSIMTPQNHQQLRKQSHRNAKIADI